MATTAETIYKAFTLRDRLNDLRQDAARIEAELAELSPAVQETVEEVAARLLIDAQGQPVNGVVYWYSGFGVVRLNGTICLLPVKTMNGKELFGEEADGDN